MKIVCINILNPTEHILFNKPDSSLISKHNPFYTPNFSKQISFNLNLIVKINRIGKCIAENFATKYYNSLSFGINFIAEDLLQILKKSRLPWDQAIGFDGSTTIADFLPTIDFLNHSKISLILNDRSIFSIPLHNFEQKINTAIHLSSNFFTLKIGDLLAIQLSENFPIKPTNNIELEIDKTKILYINAK